MRLRQYPLVFLTTSLLLWLMDYGASAFSFSLGGDTSSDPISYKYRDQFEGKITVKEVKLLNPPAQSSDFMRTLQTLFPGWEFNPVSIDGRFQIVEYQPHYLSEPNFPDETYAVGLNLN
ncbi:MAG: hypothetical protein P2A85_05170 [Microcoleus anatoxicus]|uniref:hypothetical protein n=1 Tax=Microcoleus anatoxicus TaxID=2705319 RepID=UPI00366BF74D